LNYFETSSVLRAVVRNALVYYRVFR
jgi:hypothetical protein